MYMHPRKVLSAVASLGLFAMACSASDAEPALGGGSGVSGSAGAGGSSGSGTGGSVVGPTGGSGGGTTGGSGGGTTGGSGGGTTGGSGGGITGGSGGGTTGGSGGGTTGGSGGGTTGGSGGGTSSGSCNGTPSNCADIGADQDAQYYGCCDGETVYWCDDQTGTWEIHGADCASQGQSCEFDANYESMWCVDGAGGSGGTGGTGGSGGGTGGSGGSTSGSCNGTPSTCADIGADQDAQYYGCCDGETVYWCDDQSGAWEIHDADCASQNQTCAYEASYDAMWCIDDGPVDPVEPGDPPGPGPGPSCPNLPQLECTGSDCSAIVPFDPDYGDGYIDYPENGETSSNQYRSYIRRDLMMLIKYAAAKVACKTAGWNTGNGQPLGLIDMSESNGAIPGTSIGSPGHPDGTHVNGRDIDVAYYQTADQPDNRARPVCDHMENGQDAYHCVAEPNSLDAWRNAAFLGFVFEHPSARVVGADGKVGPHLDAALDYLCQNGWLTTYACSHRKLTYEVTNQGAGWYYFHHHHMHVSFTPPSYSSSLPMSLAPKCLIENCDAEAWNNFLKPYGL
jgi:hypothetical protein